MRLHMHGIGHAFLGRTVLERIALTLHEGETVAVVGPSGCGKSTLLAIAAGLVEPLRGRVRRDYSRHAIVFQEPRLLPWRTARDNIGYGLEARGVARAARHEVAHALAGAVALDREDLDKYPVELSGGMRQRVAFARALAVEPEVVYFDEPFTALDVGLRRALQDLVVASARDRGFASLFVTHDLFEAVRVAHRVLVFAPCGGTIAGERAPPGLPGERDDRLVWETTEAWRISDPLFAHVFDAEDRERRRAAPRRSPPVGGSGAQRRFGGHL